MSPLLLMLFVLLGTTSAQWGGYYGGYGGYYPSYSYGYGYAYPYYGCIGLIRCARINRHRRLLWRLGYPARA
ncbi:hypothetical protein PRIPAC_82156 [Pristionchus pacificus]|uniref:Uncharacterized protein n=1 Tax=Pristionchus pacificus TaxID=54126 RepID=A0A2A6CKF7_PRIPA|nr:hypothetical protein PRIPAC_82156 [Pristionchus pacificus]|eukprot:PDM78511.1 hypothetical protein PRIPAC_31090 [Pristionchus pacificus]